MKKFYCLICCLYSLNAMAEEVSSVSTTMTTGTFTECKDKFLGLMASCKKEKVQFPKQIFMEGETTRVVFLEERRGYFRDFYIDSINYNPKKNGCALTEKSNSGNARLTFANCNVIKE